MYITILTIIIFFMVLLFCHYHEPFHADPQMIRAFLDDIDVELLNERQPILIQDAVIDPSSLFDTVFKRQYLTHETVTNNCDPNVKAVCIPCCARFTLIFCDSFDDTLVSLHRQGRHVVDVKLSNGEVLVIPRGWHAVMELSACRVHILHDVFTWMFKTLGLK